MILSMWEKIFAEIQNFNQKTCDRYIVFSRKWLEFGIIWLSLVLFG